MGVLLLQGASGALFGVVVFYLAASLLLRAWIRIDIYQLALAMTVVLVSVNMDCKRIVRGVYIHKIAGRAKMVVYGAP